MSNETLYAVLTTIREPSPATRRMKEALDRTGGRLIIIGDRNGPASFPLEGTSLFLLQDQERLPFRLARLLPFGHYARKNLGYLVAIRDGASCIYDTDDDNSPLASWRARPKAVPVRKAKRAAWVNSYRFFTDEKVWPRGFPLRLAREDDPPSIDGDGETFIVDAPVQHGLADTSPDVDAVWRLLLDRALHFRSGASIILPPGSWCPFNSQSTWWRPPAWPLLYLPSHCSFRMTDIWRSFVAQRCLWELGIGVVFHSSEVDQERNSHDLMEDFQEEIPGYLGNEKMVRVLDETRLAPGTNAIGDNLLQCYERLTKAGFFREGELHLVHAWRDDLKDLSK
ncbi:MAG: STELLO glycosyltransferase family protein [Deltaproteobacteria bacterium]|nr:STELLO glycosyltransferase family protein [Deltaproteobacteria bacterium]